MEKFDDGKYQAIWELNHLCTGKGNEETSACGRKFIINQNYIFITIKRDKNGNTDLCYTFTCPFCGSMTDIDEEIITKEVQHYALEEFEENVYSLNDFETTKLVKSKRKKTFTLV